MQNYTLREQPGLNYPPLSKTSVATKGDLVTNWQGEAYMKAIYWSGASALALVAVPVSAQTAPETTPAAASARADANSDGSTPSDGGLAEIVVTAQRRAENLQKVPIVITAFLNCGKRSMSGCTIIRRAAKLIYLLLNI